MKNVVCGLCLLLTLLAKSQHEAENIFIITTDGVRWQEVFNGADSALLCQPGFVKDTALARLLYWDASPAERRKKLMPFFWNVVAQQGQLYGNRQQESKMNVKNVYKISYPGYNELLTGYADPLPILNAPQYNRNASVLEYLAAQPGYEGKVAAFTSWNVFPFILNRKRKGVLQNCGYESLEDSAEAFQLLNNVQDGVLQKTKTRYDLLTFFTAKNYIQQHHPRVVFLGLGETDEEAHHGRYDLYLQQLAAVDKMIAELWYAVQTDSVYRGKTAFLISTDHGRGRTAKWTSHHTLIRGSGEIWLAAIGKNVAPLGERKHAETVYQNQVAATAAMLLGKEFRTNRKTGKALPLVPIENGLAARPDATAGTQ